MDAIPLTQFRKARDQALMQWINGTDRSLYTVSTPPNDILCDDIANSFECRWQEEASIAKHDDDWHVSHFCSLGEWASNITDTLLDFRYDNIWLESNEDQDQILFRYYTRFMLIISEILTDFEDILVESKMAANGSVARTMLSATMDITQLMDYINSICKHKTLEYKSLAKLHRCNHHLPLHFEDSRQIHSFHNPIQIGASNVRPNMGGIVIPTLSSLVQVLLDGYTALDEAFTNYPTEFEVFIAHPDHGRSIP